MSVGCGLDGTGVTEIERPVVEGSELAIIFGIPVSNRELGRLGMGRHDGFALKPV